ncbi:MAG: hypothetical protein JW384_03999 [Nitrosomonadaceae bacterium]|nr:hypothetical protein [Nitrosomonadaceae bacterium]
MNESFPQVIVQKFEILVKIRIIFFHIKTTPALRSPQNSPRDHLAVGQFI